MVPVTTHFREIQAAPHAAIVIPCPTGMHETVT